MDRKSIILKHINKESHGIEIGPSYNPIAPKKDGYKVSIIDHLSKQKLIDKYKDYPVPLENIEDVDFIWKGESYQELTGNKNFYDWIIASHLLEHTPDLISFLQSCSEVIKDNGVVSLVIPDKRFCFDRFRPLTGLSQIIDAFHNKNVIHSPGTLAEFSLFAVRKNAEIAWDKNFQGDYTFANSLEYAVESMEKVINTGEYIDVHSWCFTPSSFSLLIHDLFSLKLIPFQIFSISSNNTYEFYVTLQKIDRPIKIFDRMSCLKNLEKETLEIQHQEQDSFEQQKNNISILKNELEKITNSHKELKEKIAYMENSKFWKIRSAWLKVKPFLGLKV